MRAHVVGLVACLVGCGPDDRGGGGGGDGDGDTVTVNAPLAPDAVIAYRDSDGAWTVAAGTKAPLTFSAPSGMFDVAIHCPLAPSPVHVYRLATSDLQTLDYAYECKAASAKLSGALIGQTSGQHGSGNNLQWGLDARGYQTVSTPDYTLDVAPGKHDLLATRGAIVPDRLFLRRDVEVSGNTTIDIDFEGQNALALVPMQVDENSTMQIGFVSAGGTPIPLGLAAQGIITVLPESALGPGDLQVFSIETQSLSSTYAWQASVHAGTTMPSSFARWPSAQAPVVSVTRVGAYVSLQASWTPPADAVLYRFNTSGWYAHVSPAAFETTGMLEMPDLSTVQGWDPSLSIPATGQITWDIYAAMGSDLKEALRPAPSRAGDTGATGWHMQMQY